MGKKKVKTLNEPESKIDQKSKIHEYALFFEKLVELIPARFYLPDEKEKPWFQGLSKAEKASAKKQSRENIKKARRDRLDPEKSNKSTLDLLKENLIEKEKLNKESDGEEEEEIEVRPIMADAEDERAVTYEELRERLRRKIEEARGSRNTADPDNWRKRKNERNERNYQKRQKRDSGNDDKKIAVDANDDKEKVQKDVEEASKELTFSRVKLGDDDDKLGKKKKRRGSKLKELENAMKLEEAKKDPVKGEVIAKKHSWKAAMERAAGNKVHDDPKLLKQSIHKEKKRHQKNAEKWNERVETTQKLKADKQHKRSENIAGKIHEKKMRRIAKREKKLLRPGFEGRKEGFINEGSS